eukprot:TRINITY_DN7282_c0_g1_i2.p2 TRINITY_DN7282_c0_g1~~TRINITY_DN7282_c0_g1_i2.p2  ORF type:complete len:681 (-),score=219.86 TRINITY_DN7282_c0_g1_i2:19-2061(-)
MPRLLDVLYQKTRESTQPRTVIEYLVAILKKYSKLKVVIQWMRSTNSVGVINGIYTTTPVHIDPSPQRIVEICTEFFGKSDEISFLSNLPEIRDRDKDGKPDSTYFVKEILDRVIRHVIMRNSHGKTLLVFASFLGRLNSEFLDLPREFLEVMHSIILSDPKAREDSVQAGLYTFVLLLASRQFLQLPDLLTNVIAPFLQNFPEDGRQDPQSAVMYLTMLDVLLGNTSSVKDSLPEVNLLPVFDKAQLFCIVPPVLSLYYRSQNSQNQFLIPSLERVLRNRNFAQITMTHTEELYGNLKKLNEQFGSRDIFDILSNSEPTPPFSNENVPKLPTMLVTKILQSANRWTLRKCWLDIRLILDQWTHFEEPLVPYRRLVKIIMAQSVVNPQPSSFCKLISSLGYAVLDEFVSYLIDLLKSDEAIDGGKNLPTLILEECAAETSQEFQVGNVASDKSFLDMIIPCLLSASNPTRNIFAVKLLRQLEKIGSVTRHQMTEIVSPKKSDPMHDNRHRSDLVANLLLRLNLLVPLIPTIKSAKENCEFAEFPKVILHLMALPPLQQQGSAELFSYLLNVLEVLLDTSDTLELKEQLRNQFQETDFTESQRLLIEQTLPFFRSSSLRFGSSQSGTIENLRQKRPVDPWTLLEDFSDVPLSPTTDFQATRIERTGLTYASDLFTKRQKAH